MLSKRLAARWYALVKRIAEPGSENAEIGGYLDAMPSPQNAVDLIPGWNHALPSEANAAAGAAALHNDTRIRWFIEQFGSVDGKRILELGPLEASHTYMLDRAGASVLAIEANKLSFLRCLVAKDLLRLDRAHFLLGNFVRWLEATEERYDVIVACGVLYHMRDPVHLLETMARRTDCVFLWTHYFDATAMPPDDLRRVPFSGEVIAREFRGLPVRLHTRHYYGAQQDAAFCGGPSDRHYWLERDTIIAVMRTLGFDDLRIAGDQPDHPNGPSFCLFARRSEAV